MGSLENRLRETEIYIQKADGGILLGTTAIRGEGTWIGQEKFYNLQEKKFLRT